jgi:hypothetical protein
MPLYRTDTRVAPRKGTAYGVLRRRNPSRQRQHVYLSAAALMDGDTGDFNDKYVSIRLIGG